MVQAGIKISNNDSFIPISLLNNIIEYSSLSPRTIEESDSELFFKTYHGVGSIRFKNGSQYEGNIKYGIMESTPETPSFITFKNGTMYRGDMKQNKITGNGEYIFPEGSTYVGQVLNGLRHGNGTYENKTENLKYEGSWINGLKHGNGKLIVNDMVYEGEFFEGAKHNFGKLKWESTGNYYEGEFKFNQICGTGYMVWIDSNEKYIGQWKDNQQNGFGMHIWYEPKGELKYLKNRYVGEWKDGLRHGYGVFFYSNGSKYEGLWENNIKQGFGIFTFQDGTNYKGKFQNDRMIEYNVQGIQSNIDPNTINKFMSENLMNSNFSSIANNSKYTDRKVSQYTNPGSVSSLPTNSNNNLAKETKVNKKGNKDDLNSKFNTIVEDPRENEGVGNSNFAGRKLLTPIDKKVSTITNNLNNVNQTLSSNIRSSVVEGSINKVSKATDIPSNSKINTKANYKMEPINENEETSTQVDQVVANRILKENDSNPFSTLLDITDILESEPDISKSLFEVQNVLLRFLSDLKAIYKVYSGNKDGSDRLNESNYFLMRGTGEEDSFKTNKDIHKTGTINKPFTNRLEKETKDNKDKYEIIITEGLNINADIGYAMEMKDLWKLLRDTSLLTPEFTLADFNKLYFRGPRNFCEMFALPEDLPEDAIYEYLFSIINASKEVFISGYSKNGIFDNYNNTSKLPQLKFKLKDRVYEFDIHSKRNIILMRQFFESIVRIAYLRFNQSDEPLHKKIKDLIENYLKSNLKYKVGKKMTTNTNKENSSLNSSIVEPIYRNLDTVLDMLVSNYEGDLLSIFKIIAGKTKMFNTRHSLTISFKSFYDVIIKKDQELMKSVDKYVYVNCINKYHGNKPSITEENKNSISIISYIENLLNIEMIFFEFCELICLVIRKYCLDNKLEERKEVVYDIYSRIKDNIKNSESIDKSDDKYKYYFPELPYHREYWTMIQERKQREFEEKKRKRELERFERENKMMEYYDNRLLEVPSNEEEEEYEDDEYAD